MLTAKLFTNGSSQAVILPQEIRFNENEVYIQKVGSSVILVPKEKVWEIFLDGLDHFTDDYFDIVQSAHDN